MQRIRYNQAFVYFQVVCVVLLALSVDGSSTFERNNATKQQIKEHYVQPDSDYDEAFELDVTNDGLPEIFVGFACGMAGCLKRDEKG